MWRRGTDETCLCKSFEMVQLDRVRLHACVCKQFADVWKDTGVKLSPQRLGKSLSLAGVLGRLRDGRRAIDKKYYELPKTRKLSARRGDSFTRTFKGLFVTIEHFRRF